MTLQATLDTVVIAIAYQHVEASERAEGCEASVSFFLFSRLLPSVCVCLGPLTCLAFASSFWTSLFASQAEV